MTTDKFIGSMLDDLLTRPRAVWLDAERQQQLVCPAPVPHYGLYVRVTGVLVAPSGCPPAASVLGADGRLTEDMEAVWHQVTPKSEQLKPLPAFTLLCRCEDGHEFAIGFVLNHGETTIRIRWSDRCWYDLG